LRGMVVNIRREKIPALLKGRRRSLCCKSGTAPEADVLEKFSRKVFREKAFKGSGKREENDDIIGAGGASIHLRKIVSVKKKCVRRKGPWKCRKKRMSFLRECKKGQDRGQGSRTQELFQGGKEENNWETFIGKHSDYRLGARGPLWSGLSEKGKGGIRQKDNPIILDIDKRGMARAS